MPMAEQAGHEWVNHLDASQLDLGSGDRLFYRGGTVDKKYRLSVPKEEEAFAGLSAAMAEMTRGSEAQYYSGLPHSTYASLGHCDEAGRCHSGCPH